MRRLLLDATSGGAVPVPPGGTYEVDRIAYRVADDGDPEGDLLLIYVRGLHYGSLASLPVWAAR